MHIYLYSDDVVEVVCPQGSGDATGQKKPLCHAISDADGMFTFKSIPCGNFLFDLGSFFMNFIFYIRLYE